MNIPTNLKYTKSDEWVKVDGNIVTIGVSDYAQSQLSDIVYFEFKVDPGDAVHKDQTVATLESVKAAADVTPPSPTMWSTSTRVSPNSSKRSTPTPTAQHGS